MITSGKPEEGVISMQALVQELLQVSQDIRHVAVNRNGELVRAQRQNFSSAGSSEWETFEELVLNPTLLTMVTQHGRAHHRGCISAVIRYGDIEVLLIPVTNGCVSLGLELNAHPIQIRQKVRQILDEKLNPSEHKPWSQSPLISIE